MLCGTAACVVCVAPALRQRRLRMLRAAWCCVFVRTVAYCVEVLNAGCRILYIPTQHSKIKSLVSFEHFTSSGSISLINLETVAVQSMSITTIEWS